MLDQLFVRLVACVQPRWEVLASRPDRNAFLKQTAHHAATLLFMLACSSSFVVVPALAFVRATQTAEQQRGAHLPAEFPHWAGAAVVFGTCQWQTIYLLNPHCLRRCVHIYRYITSLEGTRHGSRGMCFNYIWWGAIALVMIGSSQDF